MTAGFPALAQLRCPACGRAFARRDGSLICESGHCYDVARKGFVNLAPNRRQDAVYGRALFESRRRVLESGAYAPVVQTLSRLCKAHAPNRALLVDAGCGEGFYARSLAPLFDDIVAFDLSREGIALASSGPKDETARRIAFLVADLTRIPVRDGAATALLDVFTPAHYAEFARVLAPGGLLLKALPRSGYLCEIRALTGKGEYDNGDVVRRLDEAGDGRFAMLAQETLTYAAPLDASVRADAVRMTPMAHTADLSSLDLSSLSEITIDMEIIALARL